MEINMHLNAKQIIFLFFSAYWIIFFFANLHFILFFLEILMKKILNSCNNVVEFSVEIYLLYWRLFRNNFTGNLCQLFGKLTKWNSVVVWKLKWTRRLCFGIRDHYRQIFGKETLIVEATLLKGIQISLHSFFSLSQVSFQESFVLNDFVVIMT